MSKPDIMAKKLLVLSILLASFSIANATDVDPIKKVDPEKEQKAKQEKNVLKEKTSTLNAIDEDYRAYKVKDEIIPSTYSEEAEKQELQQEDSPKEENSSQSQDVQSFNFLYYIIHHFKFSDFISE